MNRIKCPIWFALRRALGAGLALVVALLPVLADTVQNFDAGGTAYELAVNNVLPAPAITAGGPTGNFLRLVHASTRKTSTRSLSTAATWARFGSSRRILISI